MAIKVVSARVGRTGIEIEVCPNWAGACACIDGALEHDRTVWPREPEREIAFILARCAKEAERLVAAKAER